jgi:Inner membrane component of T3SS, cytoplasmic domain
MLMKKSGMLVLGLIISLLLIMPAAAQSGTTAAISPPDTISFPQITFFLDVRDSSGNFILDLGPENVVALESGQELPLTSLAVIHPGAQWVVALNPARPFAIRDAQGNSRYDFIRQSLVDWAGRTGGDGQDDLSLLTTNGTEATHISSPAQWLAALESYQPDTLAASPGVDVLARALDVVLDTPPQTGMGRAVLFVTAPLDPGAATALDTQSVRAVQAGVRINVWMVGSQNLFDSPEAELLRNLASATQGDYYAFSGVEDLPDVEAYLAPIRSTYRAIYDSALAGGENYQLAAVVHAGGETIQSPVQTFSLEVSPPNPIFVSPPVQIERSLPVDGELAQDALTPVSQNLEILVEFPDGHQRLLESTTLYVDGQEVEVNTAPPFDQFVWDLSQIQEAGSHTLRAEAVDMLGLVGSSIDIPVRVSIEIPRQDAMGMLSRNGPLLAAAAIVMAGAVLFLVLIVGGRLRPRGGLTPARGDASNRQKTRPAASRQRTRPVRTRRMMVETAELPAALVSSKTREKAEPRAYLSWLESAGNGRGSAAPVAINGHEVIFGSDRRRATVILEDPSVEKVHACLRQARDGFFELKDEGSVAGTWVNYAPVSRSWTRLEEGDLIHVGRVGFRFNTSVPTRPRRTKVTHRGGVK